ncbi:Uncharacterised protein [uncultured Eubacterium sp.]|nr:Uncharacterised protein [uncultured Eubacterium sp.]
MVKIKKCVYKLLTVVLALLLVLNASATGVLADNGSTSAVPPEPENYSFVKSTGTITGLKADYLNGLTDAQKQNIRLVIPEEIDGVKVTAIGDSAFSKWYNSKYDGYDFVALDLSDAMSLQSIGKDAFYNCKKLAGSLQIPDKVVKIGENAFRECTAFNGNLQLSKNLKEISKYAFWNCTLKGELLLPPGIEKIGDHGFGHSKTYSGYTGTLTIPMAVEEIGSSTFAELKGITKLIFFSDKVSKIGGSAFVNTGITGAVYLPDSVQSIGSKAFQGTNIETIYLPKITRTDTNSFIASQAFGSCPKLNAIVCADGEDYQIVSKIITSTNYNTAQVCYPITVTFDDGNSGVYKSKECLYNRQYNFEKDSTGVWTPNNNYKFPSVISNESKVWATERTSIKPVKETENVKGDTLYAINKLENPVITYSEGIDKVYDGKEEMLTVTATHPLAKPIGEAKDGDVVFYYTWNWETITASNPVLKGYDKNIYEVQDVREPGVTIACSVKVQACKVNGTKATVFYTEAHDFPVFLRQAESTVNPNVTSGVYKISDGQTALPEIRLSAGDTPGTIAWDAGQQLKEGFGIYTWTFTPEPNGVDNTTSNFKSAKGQVELYVTTKDVDKESLEDKIDNIPLISEEEPVTKAEKDKILDAYFAYESSDESVKEQISEEKQEKIYEAINALPQIETSAEGLQLGNEQDLLKNMTPKDADAIKTQENAKCMIKVISEKATPADEINEAIKQIAGNSAKVEDHFDVAVIKTVGIGDKKETEVLKTVKKPLKLVFHVPKALQSANRKFFIIRAHEDAEGKVTAEKLLDEDNDPSTITVASDKFSTYAIAYAEEESSGGSSPGGSSYVYNISAFAGDHGVITPSGTAYAYYGSTKTFSFTPDEGYKVADVVVDGGSIGAVFSYTFENITKAHTIAVTFEPIADDQDRIINGVKATTIKASSSAKKGSITVKWKKSTGFKVDYFQVFRSTKKNRGYGNKTFYTTKTGTQKSYKNTKKLRKGTRYYYKVRGVRTIDGVKVYTKWSNKAIRIAK